MNITHPQPFSKIPWTEGRFHGNGTLVVDIFYGDINERLHDSCTRSLDMPPIHGGVHSVHGAENPWMACNSNEIPK